MTIELDKYEAFLDYKVEAFENLKVKKTKEYQENLALKRKIITESYNQLIPLCDKLKSTKYNIDYEGNGKRIEIFINGKLIVQIYPILNDKDEVVISLFIPETQLHKMQEIEYYTIDLAMQKTAEYISQVVVYERTGEF